MKRNIPPIAILRARQMRKEPTEAERVMWRLLNQHLPAARFRRQVPMLHYIADFARHVLRVVIEAQGYRVVRFWNAEVLHNPQGCVARLMAVLPSPPPNCG